VSASRVQQNKPGRPAERPGGQEPEPGLRNRVEWNDSQLADVRELVGHGELLYLVTQREVRVRYKQTALGALWAIVQPFSLMIAFTVFVSFFAGVRSGEIPYPLFSYAGLLPWTFFSTAVSFAVPSLIANAQIISKTYFPREIFPLASVLAALVDFAVAAVVLLGMLVFYHVAPTWNLLYAVPMLAILVIFTTGVCLLLSALTVLYRDVRFTVPLLIQILMFITPILYPASTVPEQVRAPYMMLNPLAVVIDGFRRAVVEGQSPDLLYLASATLISLGVLWLSYTYFKHLEGAFADII
jgi:lipopolysaccharide transport system permease protein